MRPGEFGEPADHGIDVLDVVDQAAVGMAEAVVDRRAVVVHLRRGDDLGGVAPVLAVDLAQKSRPAAAARRARANPAGRR